MYNLKITVSSGGNDPDWFDKLFDKLGCSITDHDWWRREISTPINHVVFYTVEFTFDGDAIELWDFVTKEHALNFYNKISSDDQTVNENRPFGCSYDDLNNFIKELNGRRIDVIISPDGTEEVLYDTSA